MEMIVDNSSKFWDKIADRYAQRAIADEAAYRRKLAVSQQFFRADMEVLEFGCGTGSTALRHGPYVKHVRAIDVSPRMIEICRGRQAETDVDNVTFEVGSIEALDAPDASFDVILGNSILHLLVDRDAVIAKVRRLLKPGGVFISSTTCLADTVKIFKYIEPIGRALGLMPVVKVFTADDLVAALRNSGLEIAHRWHPGRGKAVFIVARRPH